MAKRKLRKPYKGILTAPVPKYDHKVSPEDNFWRWLDESASPKLGALFDHYGIDRKNPHKWFSLAFCLAIDHVPLFKPSWPEERKTHTEAVNRLNDLYLFALLASAEEMNESVKNTVRQITKPTSPYDPFRGKNPGTLRERYYLLKEKRSHERRRLMKTIAMLKKASAKDLGMTERGARALLGLASFAESKIQ